MISRDMQSLNHQILKTNKDEYGDIQKNYTQSENIDIAIYYKQLIDKFNLPIYQECTHIGLTADKSVKNGDKIGNYEILAANPQGKYTQLILKEV